MSAERLREMLSEATPRLENRATNYAPDDRKVMLARMRLDALAPDAIALLADMADHLKWLSDGASHELLLRLDALCGDER